MSDYSFPDAFPLNFHFTTQLLPTGVSVPRSEHREGRGTTGGSQCHTHPWLSSLGHHRTREHASSPGSQTRTEIYELCPELQLPRRGSGAPKSSQLREKCLLPGTHGQPQLDQFLNGLSKLQDVSINYSNSELFLLHCHCLFKHNKNHPAPTPRSDILLKHSNSQKNSGQCQGKSNQFSLILFTTGKWLPTESCPL